jgi:hypothetical protein
MQQIHQNVLSGKISIFLQCRQHNYMEAEAKIVWNTYFFITDANESFQLDQVPAGKYKVTDWHPYAGEHTQKTVVSEGTETKADFTVEQEILSW